MRSFSYVRFFLSAMICIFLGKYNMALWPGFGAFFSSMSSIHCVKYTVHVVQVLLQSQNNIRSRSTQIQTHIPFATKILLREDQTLALAAVVGVAIHSALEPETA